MLRRRGLFVLALPLAAAMACSSPDPRYYALRVVPGAAAGGGPKVVMVKDIGLASYLDRREIVRSSEGYRLDVMANDWWGEQLSGMLARVLVLELSQRLPQSRVYAESGAINADANAIVAVNIQRLDADRSGTLHLLAQVAIEFNRPKRSAARNFAITKAPPTPDIAGLVAAESDAIAELAEGIAMMLQP
ncbi:MAG: membrane integrity-associated transporter subunit PqiC [Alphaproteobacteria bacterium]|nr:membrane integrity-associated transporter subunit PqiC [Alphaproteobacteria bacterium]MBV8407625.1 membrane integrity-associated transporter subunit PqiC [Alphaproteobacteria bacterium]